MALTTKSTSGSVATRTVPAAPLTTSTSLAPAETSARRAFSAPSSVPSESTFGRHRTACSTAASTLLPAAIDTTAKRSGYCSAMLRVLRPMEPVDPRMAMCFMESGNRGWPTLSPAFGEGWGHLAIGQTDGFTIPDFPIPRLNWVEHGAEKRIVPQHWSGEEQRIDAVQQPAVTRQQRARILHPGAPFDGRFHQVAELRHDVEQRRQHDRVEHRRRLYARHLQRVNLD